jgi:hypothetical protein
MMKERPILFNGESVRAILDGRKTMTRRVVKPQPPDDAEIALLDGLTQPEWTDGFYWKRRCPFGVPGDRLWVRETFVLESSYGVESIDNYPPPFDDGRPIREVSFDEDPDFGPYWEQPHYRATDPEPDLAYEDLTEPWCRWRPSIHMPRWACRLFLEVVSVRVERLQEITNGDVEREGGISTPSRDPNDLRRIETYFDQLGEVFRGFERSWDAIYAKRGHSWESNPWVWVVEFKEVKP